MAQQKHDENFNIREGSKMTGFFVGLLVGVGILIPLISAVGFATNPYTQYLFSGRLSDISEGGYRLFWWLVAAILFALPFVIGYAVDRLNRRGLAIVSTILIVVVIAALVIGMIFVF